MTSKVKDQSDIENNNSFTELKSILVKPDEKKMPALLNSPFALYASCFYLSLYFQ